MGFVGGSCTQQEAVVKRMIKDLSKNGHTLLSSKEYYRLSSQKDRMLLLVRLV